jgi:hypothetical protein
MKLFQLVDLRDDTIMPEAWICCGILLDHKTVMKYTLTGGYIVEQPFPTKYVSFFLPSFQWMSTVNAYADTEDRGWHLLRLFWDSNNGWQKRWWFLGGGFSTSTRRQIGV